MAKSLVVMTKNADLSRVRNFAEELSLELGDAGVLPMDDADAAVDRFTISRVKNRGVCESIIKKIAKKHRIEIVIQ